MILVLFYPRIWKENSLLLIERCSNPLILWMKDYRLSSHQYVKTRLIFSRFLKKERKASPKAGPLHAWLTATQFALFPRTGLMLLLWPRLGRSHESCRSQGAVQGSWHDAQHLTSAACFTSRFSPHPQHHSVRVSTVDSGTRLFTKLTRQRWGIRSCPCKRLFRSSRRHSGLCFSVIKAQERRH